jgi:hypothetical protein
VVTIVDSMEKSSVFRFGKLVYLSLVALLYSFAAPGPVPIVFATCLRTKPSAPKLRLTPPPPSSCRSSCWSRGSSPLRLLFSQLFNGRTKKLRKRPLMIAWIAQQ